MDLKDKIVGLALAAAIGLIGWNLHETWTMKEQVYKLLEIEGLLLESLTALEVI